jgi:hypothetical protein
MNLKTLKHIFLSVITTPTTQQIVDHIYAKNTGFVSRGWGDFPPWNQRLTVEADTDEYLALLASVQLKGIMWMLLQHREQLGHKTITRISVFKDEVTGEVGYDALHRGPCVYIELGDVQSGAGNTGAGPSGAGKAVAEPSGSGPSGAGNPGAGNPGAGQAGAASSGAGKRPADGQAEAGPSGDRPAKAAKSVDPSKLAPRCKARYNSTASAGNATAIKVGPVRRADNSPGDTSMGSGSESSGSSSGGGSEFSDSVPPPPLSVVDLAPYIRQGGLAAAYMRASDEDVTADLVSKGKLQAGQTIASPFTDHSAFKNNGWEESDASEDLQGAEFELYVSFLSALKSLGISTQAKPKGNQQNTVYEHRLPWMRNGQSMNVSVVPASQRHYVVTD